MNLTAKQQLRRNPSNANYSNPIKTYTVPAVTNEDGTISIPVQPVVLVNADAEPMTVGNAVMVEGASGVRQQVVPATTFGLITSASAMAAEAAALNYVSNFGLGGWEPQRTPVVFVHALCTTVAPTIVWNPAATKFRLMGYVIVPSAGLAAAGIQLITLLDEAAAINIAHQVYLPAAANIVNQPPIVVNLPGNGYLSAVTNNNLNVTLTSACTAGAISVMAYGTEE